MKVCLGVEVFLWKTESTGPGELTGGERVTVSPIWGMAQHMSDWRLRQFVAVNHVCRAFPIRYSLT